MKTRPDSDRLEYALTGAIDDLTTALTTTRGLIGDKPELLYVEAGLLIELKRFTNQLRQTMEMLS